MPQSSVRAAALIAIVLATATPALAQQQDSRFALVASFPSPIVSLQWQATDRFALRLEGSYTFSDETSEFELPGQQTLSGRLPNATGRIENTSHNGTVALVGLVTVHRSDRTQLYLAPRALVGFSRQSLTEIEDPVSATTFPTQFGSVMLGGSSGSSSTAKASYTSPGAGLSFGIRSNVLERVALFGEAGLTWSRSNTPGSGLTTTSLSAISSVKSRRTTVGTRAVAGVMFLF